MKIYVVTQGEYSDYHIVATFVNEDVANDFAKIMNSKIKGYSQDYSVEPHDILSTINEYNPNTEYLEISYRSDTKEINYENKFNRDEDYEEERKTIYFYSEGFYIAIMKQPLTVKNLLGAEKIMGEWVAQIEYELQNTFNGDLKAYEKHYKNAPF
jgi:hypothetical protein